MARYGLLLTNIGTPKSFTPEDVGTYLDQFLMDPHVIRAPWPIRALLVKGLIVPFRAARSAALYRKIWTKEGSPLMVHSKRFVEKLQDQLGPDWAVRIGMRYGNPSFTEALRSMRVESLEKVVLFPLYPQYALSATQSSLDHAVESLKQVLAPADKAKAKKFVFPEKPKVISINPFYKDRGFINSWKDVFLEEAPAEYDHVVMSFHGLPKGHLTTLSSECAKCPRTEACPSDTDQVASQQTCYRRQCFRTAQLLSQALGLGEDKYTVSFQSRLGPKEWIAPNTIDVVDGLRKKGVEKLVVLCPSFVTDCLETLEEMQMSLKERFINAGGKEFTGISCLNTHPTWVNTAQELACKSVL